MKQFLLFLLFGFSFLFSQTQQRATFYPSPTNTYDLGTSSYYWNNSYIRYGNFVYVFLGSDTAATKAYARSLSGGGLSGYVPYTGASSDLNLGIHSLTLGNLLFATDGTYNIGASGSNRPFSIFAYHDITSGYLITGGTLNITQVNLSGSIFLNADNLSRISGNTNGAIAYNYNTGGTGNFGFYGGTTSVKWSCESNGNVTQAGTLTVGSISGVVKQSSGLQSCVTNATGYLYNDGVGNFSYATPAGAGTIVASDTTILHNEIAAKGVGTIIASDTTILHNEIAAKGIGTIVASDTTILHNEIAAKGVGTIVASDTTILHNEIAAKGVGTIVAADTTIIHNEIVGLRGIDTTRAVAREGLLMTLVQRGTDTVRAVAREGLLMTLVQRGTDTVRAVAREGLLAPLISPSFTTPALGTPSAGALGSCTATTQTGGDNSTKLATTAYTDAATPNSTYRKILSAQGYIIATKVAGTYMIGVMDSVVKSGNSRLQPLAMINYLAADYPTVNNKTTKLRVVGILSVNNTAPSANFTLGLYPVTSGAGGAGLKIYSVGSVVTGSAPTILNTPAGSSMTVITGSDFTPPADGIYCIGIITSATIATSSLVEINASLQVHNP